MLKTDRRSAAIWRFGALLAIGLVMMAVSGCSMPSVFGSDDSPLPLPPPLETDAEGNVADNTGRKKDDAEVSPAPEADGEYPDLADVPEGAEATKAAEKAPEAQAGREQLASGLVADREQAKYTDEELRGGKVAALSPPRPQPPAPPRSEEPVAPAAPEPVAPQAPAAQVSPPAPAPVRAPAPASGLTPASPSPSATPLTPQAPRSLPPRTAAAAPVQTATAYSTTTFQPSRAQPLPADLAASLPAGVAQRYQETLRQPVPGAPAGLPVAPVLGGRAGGAYVSIPFASGSSQLSSGDQRTIAQVARAAKGGFSRIRVVGHASSSASSQSESQRLLANWEVSQARATAVADELVRQGVDVARIVIEAVGDSQAASAGGYMDAEAAARRVDLFLE